MKWVLVSASSSDKWGERFEKGFVVLALVILVLATIFTLCGLPPAFYLGLYASSLEYILIAAVLHYANN